MPIAGTQFMVDALVTNPAQTPQPTGSIEFDFGDGTPVVTVPMAYRVATATHTYSEVGVAKITATYSGDANFTPASAVMSGQIVRSAPGVLLNVFGDSISYASNTPAMSGNWVNIVGYVEGWSLNDQARPGYHVADECPMMYQTAVTPSTYSAVLLGQNDIGGDSAAQYANSMMACTAWILIPTTSATGTHPKVVAQDSSVAQSGIWLPSILYPEMGLSTTQPGASITATIAGSAIYIGLSGTKASNYTVDVFVDGQLAGEYSPAIVYAGSTTQTVPWGIRIPVAGSELTASHTVTTVCKSPGTSGCFVDWIGGNGFVAPNAMPHLLLGEPYVTNQAGATYDQWLPYIQGLRQVGQSFQSDGLGVAMVDVVDNFNGNFESQCLVDGIHPALCGHMIIAADYIVAADWLFTNGQRIDFGGQTTVSYSKNPIPVAVSATSGLPVTLTVVSGPATAAGSTITPTGVGTVTLQASQTGDENYLSAATETESIQIIPATPAITWSTPSAITYGTALSAAQLNAAASVPGTFLYNPPAGSVPAVGNDTLSVAFTPTDTANYATATAAVSLTVNKATPSVTAWPTASAIAYGQTLANSMLTGGASTPAGSFAWTTPTTAPGAGTPSETVTFTPTDTTDYNTVAGPVTLTVNKATPAITWSTPSAITYGTALSAAQLNATASVPGTFLYNPPVGSVPAVGNDTLSVAFTPTDTANYTTATASVTLTVNPAPGFGPSGASGSNTPITVRPGSATGNTSTISVAGTNGFSGTVNLSCSIGPTAAVYPPTCSLSPASVTLNGSTAQTSTLTVDTTAATAGENQMQRLFWLPASGTALALVLMVGIPRQRRNWLAMLGLAALFATIGAIGCGGSGSSGNNGGGNPGTSSGTYVVTVTGTGTSSGSTSSVTATVGTVTLTVN